MCESGLNNVLPDTRISIPIWWRMTWRKTLFSGCVAAFLYFMDGYDIYSTILHPTSVWHLLVEFFIDAPIMLVLLFTFSVFILKKQIWKNPIKFQNNIYKIVFVGTSKKNTLKTTEAIMVFLAIAWRSWVINGLITFLLWWIPGFLFFSFIISEFFAITWYVSYPLGRIRIGYSQV